MTLKELKLLPNLLVLFLEKYTICPILAIIQHGVDIQGLVIFLFQKPIIEVVAQTIKMFFFNKFIFTNSLLAQIESAEK